MKSMAANRNEVVVVVVVVVAVVFIVVVVGRYHDVTVVVWHCRERERERGRRCNREGPLLDPCVLVRCVEWDTS